VAARLILGARLSGAVTPRRGPLFGEKQSSGFEIAPSALTACSRL